ncbi:putative nuclear pore complex protein Nup50 [Operophtera brumata]|uniref:Putative nuclear pore complex protein Nup50 n=1 Tax=Operophtera brumata TaxID=104452 RepID=A0A0L7LS02_OPEBR|nr:putative nuclear pore complex protein Nup50 [Operophtera brumata]
MSAKRSATTDLNHDNWDQEDPTEHEEMGTFKAASRDVLEKRVIRTAKRRSQVTVDEGKKSVFSGFGGFNKSQPSSFDFLANVTNGSKNTNGAGSKCDTAVTSSLFSSKPSTSPSGGLFGATSNAAKPAFSTAPLHTTPFASSAKTEIPSMTFSSSKADSTVGDSPFKIQSVSSSADSNAKSSTAAQVSSTLFGVSSTSQNQNKSPLTTNTAFKQPVSSTSTVVQNTATIATQSNNKNESAINKDTEIEKARNKYYSKLKGLNESVSSWIVKHVEKTPLCFLTPIFKDYENYLKEIQEEYEAAKEDIETKIKEEAAAKPVFGFKDGGASLFTNNSACFTQDAKNTAKSFGINITSAGNSNTTTTNTGFFGITSTANASQPSTSKTITTPTKGFSLGVTSSLATNTNSLFTTTNVENTGASPSQGFSFGIKPAASVTSPESVSPPSKGISFGITSTPLGTSPFTASQANTGSPAAGFSFGNTSTPLATSPANPLTNSAMGTSPFSFGIGSGKPFSFSSQVQQNTETPKNEEEEDQPPKVEYTPVVEENSVFDKKCKIFVKKDGNFVDKGVGTLYVKKIEESGKHQLLVRANTNLGTVLLNLILASAVPTQRMGKNNVMLVCIPTPDAKPPPTPVLIRVKTGEEADGLLEILDKYKS